MDLSVQPPLPPMLARLARELPEDGFLYEPKWDGFRCLAFRSGDEIDLRSRHDRPLGRYFPELVGAFAALAADRLVLDGESRRRWAGRLRRRRAPDRDRFRHPAPLPPLATRPRAGLLHVRPARDRALRLEEVLASA